MAYKISYTPEDTHRYPQKVQRQPGRWGKYYIAILILAAVLCLKQVGIPNFLIPGNAEVTKKAAQTMITEIKSGESLEDAITTFCMDIINSAK